MIKGHAIECRINAEDPYNNFMPSIGTITAMTMPNGPGVRIDAGVNTKYAITPYYDPMISKLICRGETRAEAILRMRRALAEYRIMGVKTNIPFHQRLVDSTRFQAGQFDTAFVEERFSMEEEQSDLRPEIAAIVATLAAHEARQKASQIIRKDNGGEGNWKRSARWSNVRQY